MRRAPWFKPLAAAMGLWFCLFIGEPSLLSPCGMHGAFARQSASGGVHTAHASHGGMTHKEPVGSTRGHHGCQCVRGCTAGDAPLPPDRPAVVAFGATTYEQYDVPPTGELRPPQPPAFARPYTTGPPRA